MALPFVDFGKKDEFSLKNALGNTKKIIPILKERGQTHYAVSNYGEISNWVQQLFVCKKEGIIPILGMETFVNNYRIQQEGVDNIVINNLLTGESRELKQVDEAGRDLVTLDYSIALFARTIEGYYNIIKIHNDAQLYGIDKRPRTSDKFIETHGAGIIAIMPTPFSEVSSLIFNQMKSEAMEKYNYYKGIFDKVYIAITLVEEDEYKEINEVTIQFCKENNIPFVPVCNSHYHLPSEEEAFFTAKKLSNLRGGLFYEVDSCPGMYYRSKEEVDRLYNKRFKSEIFNQAIYEESMYNLESLLKEFSTLDIDTSVKLPKFENGAEKLREKAWKGFLERGYDKKGSEYLERFEYEYKNIVDAEFTDYFLLLEETFNWYVNDLRGLRNTGRGSAAGSLILNCIGCTDLDPIEHNLLFERFIDASRFVEIVKAGGKVKGEDLPDVDSDYSTDKKDLVKQHFRNVYGENCTASIGTVGIMKTKSCLKDLARLYDVPQEEINNVTAVEMKSYIETDDTVVSLEKLKSMFPALDMLLEKYPKMGETFEKLHGSITNWGTHAGGVLVTDLNLADNIPLRRDSNGNLVTCWQEGTKTRELGQMGFIKMDTLAIDQLNIMEDTIRLIKEKNGTVINITDIPLNDHKALDQMNKGDSVCIFQFDTPTALKVIKKMNGIHSFEDLGSLSTLMRPAALQNKFDSEFGKRRKDSKDVYIPECLKPYLGATFGLPIYQEHIMQIAMAMAGFDKNDGYKFMKILYKGKMKTKEDIDYWKKKFTEGCAEKIQSGEVKPNYPEEMFNQLLAFQGYGFCKSHATAYAVYAAYGLWFKAYYPLEFMCANLSVTERSPELNRKVRYCQTKGFKVLPPTVQKSKGKEWLILDGTLIAPLGNIKGFGVNDIKAVLENRPYSSVTDFMDKTNIGKSKFEMLLFAGALDCFGEREFLYNWYTELYSKKSKKKTERLELFFEDVEQDDCVEIKTCFTPLELELAFEEMNGFSIQENLVIKYASLLKSEKEAKTIAEVLAKKTNKYFFMLCKIMTAKEFTSKAGKEFVKMEFSDGIDYIETVMQKHNYNIYSKSLKPGNVVLLPVQLADDKEGIYVDNLEKKNVRVLEG